MKPWKKITDRTHIGMLALPALLFLATILHLPGLPWWSGIALALAAVCRLLPEKQWSEILRLALLALIVSLAGLQQGWLAPATIRLALLTVLLLKWAEYRHTTEEGATGTLSLIASGALVALATGILYWPGLVGLAALLGGIILWLLTLAFAENMAEAHIATAGLKHLSAVRGIDGQQAATSHTPWKQTAGMLLRSLPLALVFFVFFPRIPGPLWDIGLTLGLPLVISAESKPQGMGISSHFAPGNTVPSAKTAVPDQDSPILVAEFSGWVPETTRLYWRGPVFYDFDGQEWQLAPMDTQCTRLMAAGWNQGKELEPMLTGASQRVDYQIRLTPHGEVGLYALDMPARLTAESYVSPDLQLRSMTAVCHEMVYTLSSWLNIDAAATPFDTGQRARALTLPPGNPRLKALGTALQHDHPDSEERAREQPCFKNHLARLFTGAAVLFSEWHDGRCPRI